MRIPSLHISADILENLIRDYFKGNKGAINNKHLVDYLLINGRKYSITNRNILVDAKNIAKLQKVNVSTRDDTSEFVRLLGLVRKRFKHRGITPIAPGSKDWLQAKVITESANIFCKDFGLGKKVGYVTYIELGLGKMKKFAINFFPNVHSSICTTYEAIQITTRDNNWALTDEGYILYQKLCNEKVGIIENYKSNPERYQYFVKAKDEAVRIGVKVKHYIQAQFDGLEWANAIPTPEQLIGDKAISRLKSYMAKNEIKVESDKPTINWKKIKK